MSNCNDLIEQKNKLTKTISLLDQAINSGNLSEERIKNFKWQKEIREKTLKDIDESIKKCKN